LVLAFFVECPSIFSYAVDNALVCDTPATTFFLFLEKEMEEEEEAEEDEEDEEDEEAGKLPPTNE